MTTAADATEPDDGLEDLEASYRPVSPLAVAALVAGCLSAVVLVTPLAAAVPVVAAGLAAVALVDLRRSAGRKAGRLAALVGLALAIGFAAQAATDAVVTRWIVGRRVAAATAAWLDAIREDRLLDAVSMTGPFAIPLSAPHPRGPEPPATDRAAALAELPAVQAVAGCGERPPILGVRRDPGGEAWTVRIDLGPCGRQDVVLRIEVASRVDRGPIERWLVTGFALEP